MDLIQFIAERFNYWIVIILMMTGLYTVIARGNLVKKIIGLNIFQTSVFIYYITIGKIAGGTAPIYVPGDMEARTDHGGGHSDSGHGASDHGEGGHSEDGHGNNGHGEAGSDHQGSGEHSAAADLHHVGHHVEAGGAATNDLSAVASAGHDPAIVAHTDVAHTGGGSLHGLAGEANDALAVPASEAVLRVVEGGESVTHAGAEAAISAAGEAIYSNPLPHVLILTAIVVGIATTAVGLALAVRIREAYGTIEEDELEAADNIAEFGVVDPKTEGAGA